MHPLARIVACALALAGAMAAQGCIGVPPEVRAEFAPPDGSRPNNYGRLQGGVVRPDRPSGVPEGAAGAELEAGPVAGADDARPRGTTP